MKNWGFIKHFIVEKSHLQVFVYIYVPIKVLMMSTEMQMYLIIPFYSLVSFFQYKIVQTHTQRYPSYVVFFVIPLDI